MTWAGSEDDDGDGHGDEGEGGDGDDVIDDYPRPREWLGQKTLDRVTYKHLFLMVLEAGKSKVKVLAALLSGEVPLSRLQTASCLLCPYMAKRK